MNKNKNWEINKKKNEVTQFVPKLGNCNKKPLQFRILEEN